MKQQSLPSLIFLWIEIRLMRQRIGYNIDAHGVGHLFREAQKVIVVFAFAFPAVAQVVVVAE